MRRLTANLPTLKQIVHKSRHPIVPTQGSLRASIHAHYLINTCKYAFCFRGSPNQKAQAQPVGNVVKAKDQNATPASFIQMLRQYSRVLSQDGFQNPKNLMKSTQNFDQKMLKEIDEYLSEAGTNIKQISKSLQSLASKLETMQTKTLHSAQKQSHSEYLNLLQKVHNSYFNQPSVVSYTAMEAALYLLQLQTKTTCLVQLLYGTKNDHNLVFKHVPDISHEQPFSEAYKYAWSRAQVSALDAPTKKAHNLVYELLGRGLVMFVNAVVREQKWQNQLWQKIVFGMSFPMSLVNLQKAELNCYRLWRNPKIAEVKNLLDIPEKGLLQHAKKVIYPSIKTNFFIYTHNGARKQSIETNDGKAERQQNSASIFKRAQNAGRILVLAHEQLEFKSQKPEQSFPDLGKLVPLSKQEHKMRTPKPQIETVIIHMHGGGFISMSSELMQNHTRRWANSLKIPVFSLDYRKPPQHRFPGPLHDCVTGYKFIVEQISQYMNIRPRNIILAGDSAGGNLACALQLQLMKEKYPVLPQALFLMYPAVDLRKRYTPSRLHSFNDAIFTPSFLMLCQQQYLGSDPRHQHDPLASPILASEGYINPHKSGTKQAEEWPQCWPYTHIMVGAKDPLYDDSARLLEKLAKSNIPCKMTYYKDFSHGFMSMDQVLPGCKQAIEDSIRQLTDIVQMIRK